MMMRLHSLSYTKRAGQELTFLYPNLESQASSPLHSLVNFGTLSIHGRIGSANDEVVQRLLHVTELLKTSAVETVSLPYFFQASVRDQLLT